VCHHPHAVADPYPARPEDLGVDADAGEQTEIERSWLSTGAFACLAWALVVYGKLL